MQVSANFQRWYMSLAAPGPHLATVFVGSNLHYDVVQQGQIPSLRPPNLRLRPFPSGFEAFKKRMFKSS